MNKRTPSGVTVKVLDLSSLQKAALENFNAHQAIDKKEPATSMSVGTYGIATSIKSLEAYVLCTEGVGEPIRSGHKVSFDLYAEYDGPSGKSFSILPSSRATVTAEELMELPVLEEKPLEEFIRSFGRRLEVNYDLCRKELSK